MYAKNSPPALLTILSDCEVMLTRIFDARREVVFKAHTDPDLIPQWWGLRSNTTEVEKIGCETGWHLAFYPARCRGQ